MSFQSLAVWTGCWRPTAAEAKAVREGAGATLDLVLGFERAVDITRNRR